MRLTRLALVMGLVLIGDLALATSLSPAKKEELRLELVRRLQASPVRKASYWPKLGTETVPSVVPAPRKIIEYVLIDNVLNGFREKPKASRDPSMQKDILTAWETLPPRVQELAGARIAGIFLVDDLGGSAYTEVVKDDSGRTVGAFLVVDAKVMARPSNAWMTWKESTPFKEGPYELRGRIAPEGGSERVAGLRYLLLHELGHVLGETVDAHPPWGPAGWIGEIDLADWPFLAIGWQPNPDGEGVVSQFEKGRPGKFRYYQPVANRMNNADMAASYRWLRETPFATLYSLNSIYDDFAEAFANYVHVVMLAEPYGIEIVGPEGTVLRYGSCWDEPRCAKKRAFLDEILQHKVLPAARPLEQP